MRVAEHVVCDVRDYAEVERAVRMTVDAFGKVHVVCNNAGVTGGAGTENISLQDWQWVIDINLMGVVHGVKAFLPLLKTHGEGGHIDGLAISLGDLKQNALRTAPGQKIAYVVDLAYNERNIENVIALARDADQLFIEAPFLDMDANIAAKRWHLTARQSGNIANRAGVARLIPFTSRLATATEPTN